MIPKLNNSINTQIVPVLSGGGTRLPAHVGIISALKDLNIHFQHIVGISGGSIVASLVAAGRPNEDLYRLATEVNFNQFRGFSLLKLVLEGGLSNGAHFEQWMDNELQGATFNDLKLDLHIVATDVKSQQPVFLTRNTRLTLRFPLLFAILWEFLTFHL